MSAGIDDATLERILRRLEIAHGAHGWDPEPAAYMIADHRVPGAVIALPGPEPIHRYRRYAFRVFQRITHDDLLDATDDPAVALLDMVLALAYGVRPTSRFSQTRRMFTDGPGILAYAMADVGWQMEDGKLGRFVFCVDLRDRAHMIHRLRGEPASASMGVNASGPAPIALRVLADLSAGRLPTPENLHSDEVIARYGKGATIPASPCPGESLNPA